MLMGYINPILQYGIEQFCKKAAEVGIDGVIVPDLPIYEYEKLYADFFKKNALSNIFMVTPQTSDDRITKIDELSSSFIYMLSSSVITGVSLKLSDSIEGYYKRVKAMQLKNPTIFGFGISNRESFNKACEYANGAIVGTAFVKLLVNDDYMDRIPEFVKSIKD
jgi:tryptophan synthase alpha chain